MILLFLVYFVGVIIGGNLCSTLLGSVEGSIIVCLDWGTLAATVLLIWFRKRIRALKYGRLVAFLSGLFAPYLLCFLIMLIYPLFEVTARAIIMLYERKLLLFFIAVLPLFFWIRGIVRGSKVCLAAGIFFLFVVCVSFLFTDHFVEGVHSIALVTFFFGAGTLIGRRFSKPNCFLKRERDAELWLGIPMLVLGVFLGMYVIWVGSLVLVWIVAFIVLCWLLCTILIRRQRKRKAKKHGHEP